MSAVTECLVLLLFLTPAVLWPVLLYRALRTKLPPWALGALSGLLVCVSWLAAWTVGLGPQSDVLSLLYFATLMGVTIPLGLLSALVGGPDLPVWLGVLVWFLLPSAFFALLGGGLGACLGALGALRNRREEAVPEGGTGP